jgi:hypothetical protein
MDGRDMEVEGKNTEGKGWRVGIKMFALFFYYYLELLFHI